MLFLNMLSEGEDEVAVLFIINTVINTLKPLYYTN